MISIQELSLAKRKLEKYAKEKKDESKMAAILNALADYTVTKDILIDSDITTVLREIRKTYAESEAGKEAKTVLLKWKKLVEAEESSSETKTTESTTTTSEGINETEERPNKKMKVENNDDDEVLPPSQPLTRQVSGVTDEGGWQQSKFDALSETRKKIFTRFQDIFKDGDNETLAKIIALSIEEALKNLHDPDRDSKLYIQKAQSLIFNLRKNEDLRTQLFFGVLEPSRLVTMSSSELAPASLVDERKKQLEMNIMSKRGDIYDLARQEIQKSNGLSQESEFKCRRCKGTRTSHYAMQTRSSDEPMTIFVCCLNCGCRWRE